MAPCCGCSAGEPLAPTPTALDDRASWTCPDPANLALPAWATAGFTHPTDPIAHWTGTDRSIVAVPFGWPLQAHPPELGRQNQILWVAKSGYGPLRIVATDQASGETVTKDLPDGPGPSIVDMPTAGCWHVILRWADQEDEIFVRYLDGSTPGQNGPQECSPPARPATRGVARTPGEMTYLRYAVRA